MEERTRSLRRVLILFIAYSSLQALTSIDATLRQSWLLFAALAGFALSARWTALVLLEGMLWLRLMATPAVYFYWGSSLEVVGPALACGLIAYSLWVLQERRRATFLAPLLAPVLAIAFVKFSVFPYYFPKVLMDAAITGQVRVEPAMMRDGWTRFHCAGYSIGVPSGMTSGFIGSQKSASFAFFGALPKDETLTSMALVFPRPTDFVGDPEIQAMAGQVLGVSRERDYARHILNAHDGQMFLTEKACWLGNKPPEEIDELELKEASGYLLSSTRTNWYRARLYFFRADSEFQIDVWFYGDDPLRSSAPRKLVKQRVLEQLATLRLEPEERMLPTMEDCRKLALAGSHHEQNVKLNTLLAMASKNFEALYMLGINQRALGLSEKSLQIRNRLRTEFSEGLITPESLAAWEAQYGNLNVLTGLR